MFKFLMSASLLLAGAAAQAATEDVALAGGAALVGTEADHGRDLQSSYKKKGYEGYEGYEGEGKKKHYYPTKKHYEGDEGYEGEGYKKEGHEGEGYKKNIFKKKHYYPKKKYHHL